MKFVSRAKRKLWLKMKKYSARYIRIKARKLVAAIIFVVPCVYLFNFIRPYLTVYSYDLGSAGALLPDINQSTAKKIKYNNKDKLYDFNNGQSLNSTDSIQTGAQLVTATINKNASKGVSVTDSVHELSITQTPTFRLGEGKQDGNRITYPLWDADGWLVYTVANTGTREDIVLKSGRGSMSFKYRLDIGDNLEAKLESDGSVGIYGNSLLSGQISTSTDEDTALLEKARKNAKKDTLMFTIPKPTIIEKNKNNKSEITARYKLSGDELTLAVSNLNKGHYPLSIDPSIYVATAQQFMNGNNETNINFDVENSLIEKGQTTGARFDEWNETTSLTTPSWGGGTVSVGGFIYSIGGGSISGQVFNTQGSGSFTVPSGVTSITVKAWGGGGGGGAGGSAAAGGNGGGGGYITATFNVTPEETLNVYVGGGGGAGTRNTAGGGGGGGGYSSVYRSSTPLLIASGGGGGGGGRNSTGNTGAAGGAGGGTNGIAGSASGAAGGGGYGSQSAGGSGGTGGANSGSNGSSLNGGAGADARTNQGADGSAANGGLATGGPGGGVISTNRSAGGGGGSGYYGGGGGSGSNSNTGGGGGGGGSSYNDSGGSDITNTAGSGTSPGNSSDQDRNGAGNGGNGGTTGAIGSAGSNGLIIISYGSGIASATKTVSWSKFDITSGEIESANPGNGTCSGWCTSGSYDLPGARSNYSLVTYNGFLYAIGGVDASGTRQNTVYIAKLGANGEPQLWHPTNTDKTTWSYWYQGTSLGTARSDMSAIAYNNRLYVLGGRSSSGAVSTVEYTDIKPTGAIGSWTSTTSLPSALFGQSSQVYNDYVYIIGGVPSVGGTPSSSVYYTKINSNGSLNSWVQTNSFSTGRITNGGNFTVVWSGFMYLSGGCSAVNASGYCTTISSDSQVASINADGSLDKWATISGVSSQRMGFGMVSWRDKIYIIGGCSAQNTSTGDCYGAMDKTIYYGSINQDGDASTVAQSVASGSSPCSGTSPTNCNLPGTTYVGNLLSAAVITKGYLYVIGGCINDNCSQIDNHVAYVAISSNGEMSKPATCPSGSYQGGAWCVDTTNTVPSNTAATSVVVFGGQIYLIGGVSGSSGNHNGLYRTTVNSDGSISSWTSQSLTGVGATSVSFTYAYARANPSSAGTNPGNLFIFGGCSSATNNATCLGYTGNVYKCDIQTGGAVANCSTTSQLQIGTIPGDSSPGLGIMSGTVYANYVYLIGGSSPNQGYLDTIRYAKIDNSNNIVAASGSSWIESSEQMAAGRTRSAAFGYNGYIYVMGGWDGSTVRSDIEFIKVNVSDGSLGDTSEGFLTSSITINNRWGLTVPLSNSYAYVIGGCTSGSAPSGCSARTDSIQTFQIYNNDSGAPAGYSTSANTYGTSPSRIGASSVVLNGYLYVAGGCTSTTDCTTAISDVSYTQISASGALGTWSSTTAGLPSARTWGKLRTAGGSLYYIGGQSSTSTDERSEVYYASPSSGNISSWNTASNGLPAARTKFGATVWNNRIYAVGGLDSSATATATVYVSPQLNSGGDITSAWSTSSTSFNIARSGLTAIAYANNLYVLGGNDGTNYLSDTQYAQINTGDGSVGSWTYSASLPNPVSNAEGFAANGYIYLVGGRSTATTCSPVTLVAPISANTTVATGNSPTGIGEWYETNQKYTGSRYGASLAYNDGKMYVMGGGCGSTLTYASPVTQQTTLLSQPQVAKYSIMIDNDSDVYPTYWLLNGLDNSIGAKWQLAYQSMTNTTTSCSSPAMTTWGATTINTDVTLGTPSTYTPKDSSGNNISCARFYFFNLSIDSSQAYGYPEDISRGPTINDMTLMFTSDPSKRLMHGRTFTGGLQQPDDTPIYSH